MVERIHRFQSNGATSPMAAKGSTPPPQPVPTARAQSEVEETDFEFTMPEQFTILICDDEPSILLLLGEILTEAGYLVVSARNGAEALANLAAQHVDVIFTDLRMPEMNGLEFVQSVRAANRFIPIVFVSGHASRDHFKTFLDLGVDSFIEKPFSHDDIISTARRVLREKILRDAVLDLSRLSFRAYVSLEKLLSASTTQMAPDLLAKEKSLLDRCMQQMKQAMAALLSSERNLRKPTTL
jgi:CheY-like chemotaxis protein